jgi:hypothetical protein
VSEVKKKEESYFNIVVSHNGEVTVNISGAHLNKATFNRLQLALKKAYKASINNYVRLSRQGLSHEEIEEIVNASVVKSEQKIEPVDLVIKPENIQTLDTETATGGTVIEEVKPVVSETKENLKLSLNQILERKQAKRKAEYIAEQEKTNATERVVV